MTGNTHMSLGVAAGAAAAAITGVGADPEAMAWTVVASSIGAMLPDIDEDGSMLNNLLFKSIQYRSAALTVLGGIMVLLYFLKHVPLWTCLAGMYAMSVAFVPHRSITHSLLALGIVTGITYLAAPDYSVAIAAGYISHLLADAVTTGGVPFFWPWKKRWGLKDLGIKVRSGDKVDQVTGKLAMYGGSLAILWMLFQGASPDAFLSGAADQVKSIKGLFWG
ncbi:hypothetical protein GCM10011571_19140 [Marinithermofilum abyssi]|uniref:Metal-dependent hydrolase n=1 Tax=Marinithermofilum abyssi TaxID=1571185 RepID=A0A8J2VGM5_9BACL|nr:metal-dependent hydrolase [Marinithermofilum abyssi]GGE17591.1 hypothetical protein GCM10011571_19140 [Marinithermofilum abyssi]